MAANQLQAIDTYSTHLKKLPYLEAHIVQLGRGDLAMKSLRFFGHDSIVIRFKVAPLLTGHHVHDPAWIGFMMPLSWEGDYVFNGHQARPGDLFLTSGRDGYFNVGKKRNTVMFGVRKAAFLSALCALTGIDPDSIDLSGRVISLGPQRATVFRLLFARAMEASVPDRVVPSDAYLPIPVEKGLIAEFALGLCPYLIGEGPVRVTRNWNAPAEIVRKAERVLRTSPSGVASLPDMCRAANVGITRLSECFNEIYGVSPGRHVKHARLTNVRLWLLNRENGPRSVKDAAQAHGFKNNGRFARYYLEMFGELPSQTLERPWT